MLARILVAGCCLLAMPSAAHAVVVDDNPAAAARGPGQVEVFIRGRGTQLWRAARNPNGSWTAWHQLDGVISAGPGAFGQAAGVTDVFVRGGDLQIYHRTELGTAFNNWEVLGGTALSAPTAELRQGTGQVDVFVRWSNNAIFADTWTPGVGWGGWAEPVPGGQTLSTPAAASRASNFIDVYVRGVDDQIYGAEWNGSAWGGWGLQPGGGRTTSAPAVVSATPNTLDLFVRARDGRIDWEHFDGATWSSWRPLAGVVESGPAAAADSGGNIWLFARSHGDVAVNVYNSTRWGGWHLIHPPKPKPPPPPPPAACTPAAGSVRVKTRTVRYGVRPRLTGRVRTAAGHPLTRAFVQAVTPTLRVQARTRSGLKGGFSLRLPRGHNRTLRVIVSVPSMHALACSAPVSVRVRAGAHLSASHTVPPGGRIHFRGRLRGGPIPKHGKLVEIQAFDGGRWRTFTTPRARRSRHGRFHATYHLRQTFGPRTFRFRVRVRREAGYPYVIGYSNTVRVRVL